MAKYITNSKFTIHSLEDLTNSTSYNLWITEKIIKYVHGNILEIGSGLGRITEQLIKSGKKITLSEVNKSYIRILLTKYPNNVIYLDITRVNFSKIPLNTFGTIIMINVLEHILQDNNALENIYKLLKVGGRCIILVPAHQTLYGSFDKKAKHLRRYSKKTLGNSLEASGFRVEKMMYINKVAAVGWFLNAIILRKNSFPKNQLKIVNLLVPVLNLFDRILPFDFGLSLVAVGKKF